MQIKKLPMNSLSLLLSVLQKFAYLKKVKKDMHLTTLQLKLSLENAHDIYIIFCKNQVYS